MVSSRLRNRVILLLVCASMAPCLQVSSAGERRSRQSGGAGCLPAFLPLLIAHAAGGWAGSPSPLGPCPTHRNCGLMHARRAAQIKANRLLTGRRGADSAESCEVGLSRPMRHPRPAKRPVLPRRLLGRQRAWTARASLHGQCSKARGCLRINQCCMCRLAGAQLVVATCPLEWSAGRGASDLAYPDLQKCKEVAHSACHNRSNKESD